ncbi:Transcriptional regulator MntR [compost metagenome]
MVLTSKGKKIGKRLVDRHELLEEFLGLIGVEHENIYRDVEGIEHHLSWDSITRIATLVEYFKRDSSRIRDLEDVHQEILAES